MLQNPEVIIESLERYRNNQEIEMEENKKAVLDSYYDDKKYEVLPFTGNDKGKIIVTEFIDYNCGYCKKTLLTINKLLRNTRTLKWYLLISQYYLKPLTPQLKQLLQQANKMLIFSFIRSY